MDYRLIRFVARRFSESGGKNSFPAFARAVAFISVALGTIALIISLSVLSGYEKELKENAVRFTSHISVTTFNRKPLNDKDLTIRKLISEFPEINEVKPVIQREGLLSSGENIDGVVIRGVSSEYLKGILSKNISSGSIFQDNSEERVIVIGEGLARKLGAKVGSNVIMYAAKEDMLNQISYPDIAVFKVQGIFRSGMGKYDETYTFIPFKTAGFLFKMPLNSCSLYEVKLKSTDNIDDVSEKIQDFLGYPHFCFTVFELHSSVFAWIELQKEPIPLVLGLITIVAVFNIFTILLITVIEKTYSIGILSTLGLRKNDIVRIFVYKGTLLGLAGTLFGSILSLIFSLLQLNFKLIRLNPDIYFLDALPININFYHYLVIISATVVLSFLASLIPSYLAARAKPLRAIRFK